MLTCKSLATLGWVTLLATVHGFGEIKEDAATKPVWLDQFTVAKQQAAETGRPILANFTGSDWCPPCMRLEQDVFEQAEFKAFAAEHLVLFIADFPRRKPQEEAVRNQNRALQRTYNIRGYPTILLLDAEGKELARTGFRPGGANAYIEHLLELRNEAQTPAQAGDAG